MMSKRKTIIIVTVFASMLVMMIIITCKLFIKKKPLPIIINGRAAENCCAEFRDNQYVFPLVSVLNAFGFTSESHGDEILLTRDNQQMILSFSSKTLSYEGKDYLLYFPPGTDHGYREFRDSDVYVDNDLLWSILGHIGDNVSIEINNNSIEISSITNNAI